MQSSAQEMKEIYFPYDIRFDDSESSAAAQFLIEQQLEKLGRHYDRIDYCRVAVRIPHRRTTHAYSVHIQLDIPGRRIAASRDHEAINDDSALATVINDAFHRVHRQLDDFNKVRKERRVEPRAYP